MTSKFCVVGSPIQHSLSPVIHQAAYEAIGLDFSYERHEVAQGNLSEFLVGNDYSGISVTMPLKNEAFSIASEHSEEALQTSVVNTMVRSRDAYVGYNTDVAGFIGIFGQISAPSSISLVGSGATARSAALAISRSFPGSELSVLARSEASSTDLVLLARGFGLEAQSGIASGESLVDSDLVVSTVPGKAFGDLWHQVSGSSRSAQGVLIDVTYNPWPSVASSAWTGLSFSGLELLIWQAIEQVKLFADSQGKSIDTSNKELYEIMMQAARKFSDPK
jgi:shikimate dehydrogenase